MKVALVHDFLLKLGGAERVLQVFSEMFSDAPIFTLLYDEDAVSGVFPRDRVRTSFLHKYPGIIRRHHRVLTSKMPRAIEEFDFSGFDLVISSSSAFAHGIIVPSSTAHLCYCHSPMRYAWDHSAEYIDENKIYGFKRALYAMLMKNLREWDQISAKRPDKYIANSKNVAARLKKYYKAESSVIYPPVETSKFKIAEGNSDYFLIVSTLTPYKKIDLAIQLFNKIGKRLVIIGDGPQKKFLQDISASNIDFLGFKKDEDVVEYMRNCRALIFPGEEDFGIVPVEAMACGKPVLAYGKGGALESVVPRETGELFYEPDSSSMEDALARLLYNEKTYHPHKIREHALQFSRENFEKGIQNEIKNLLS